MTWPDFEKADGPPRRVDRQGGHFFQNHLHRARTHRPPGDLWRMGPQPAQLGAFAPLETPNAATTNLRMSSPTADQNVQVASMVSSGTANRIHATKASNVGSGFLLVTSAPVGAGGVSASYTVFNDWKTGYCANVPVKNNGTTTVTWGSTLKVEGTIRNFWNGASWK
jgi:hypothetical protein